MRFVKIACLVLAFLVVFALGVWAAEAMGWFKQDSGEVTQIGGVRRLISSKTEYQVGESIWVTGWSFTDSDQIVLYSLDGNMAVRWCRVGRNYNNQSELTCGNGSGVPVDIASRNVPGAAASSVWKNLPAGEYVVYLASENGAVRYCEVTITISA